MSDAFELSDQPAASGPSHLDGLNDTQRDAVEAVEGPVLVLAGAGTGKTRVLISRLAHILLQGRAEPWEVLAVTFTNKAAREMRERAALLLGRPVEGWWVGTFHALGARILRSHGETLGLKSNFTILDEDDQLRLVKRLIGERGLDERSCPSRLMLSIIQRWKDRGLTPDKVSEVERAEDAGDRALDIYVDYQERLVSLNAVDFGDLLVHCLSLFQDRPEVLASYQNKFRYILVDEYQDTNIAQYLWLRLLAQVHRNICCVGDDDQSIYSWRGAEIGNILRFEDDFPGARVVRLERNYRSTSHILGAASGLIANNRGRLGKTLWTEGEAGQRVRVLGLWSGEDEARTVVEEIEALHAKGHPLDEIAVLVRTAAQTREFEERLLIQAVPYRVIGGARFYERLEIRDAVAYLRVIAQEADDLAFERIVNRPKRGLGAVTLRTIHRLAREAGIPLTAAARRLADSDRIKPAARARLGGLLDDFERWRGLLGVSSHVDLAAMVLEESGYAAMLRDDPSPQAPGRLDNLKELVGALVEFETLGDFLEHVSLVTDNDQAIDGDRVSLMTLHGAKGLEFDTVFLPGWEDKLFPHQRSVAAPGGLEEERRLAYVGLTRARLRAVISHAASRRSYGGRMDCLPSCFIGELPAAHVERIAASGLYGGGGGGHRHGGLSNGAAGFADFHRRWRDAESGAGPERRFEPGQRVFHQKFGPGSILAIDGDKLEVAFDKAGTKKIIDRYVT